MKTIKISLYTLIICALSSCLSGFGESYPVFSSIFIQLENNTNLKECTADSVEVSFLVSNFNVDTVKQVCANVKPGFRKSINITIKKGEQLIVKLLKTSDSTILVERKFTVGRGVNQWNDPLPRTISYCKKGELNFANFED